MYGFPLLLNKRNIIISHNQQISSKSLGNMFSMLTKMQTKTWKSKY